MALSKNTLLGFATRYASFAAARIAVVAGRWFIVVLSARQLPSADFAALAAALSTAEIIRAIGDIGVDSFAYSKLGGPSGPLSPVVRTALLTRVLASALLLPATVILWIFAGLEAGVVPVFLLILAAPSQATGVALLQKSADFKKLSTLVLVTVGASISADIFALVRPSTLRLMAFLLVVPDVVAGVSAFWLAANPIRLALDAVANSQRAPWNILKPATSRLLPSAMVAIVVMAYGRLDVVTIRPLFGTNAQADFSAGFRVIEPLFLLFAIGALALLAELGSKQRQSSNELARRIVLLPPQIIIPILLIVATITALIVYFLTGNIVGLNPRAACVAALLASAIPFRVANTLITTLLQKFGRFDQVMKAAIINGGLIFGISLATSFSIGFPGIAVSTLCAEIMTSALLRTMLINHMNK